MMVSLYRFLIDTDVSLKDTLWRQQQKTAAREKYQKIDNKITLIGQQRLIIVVSATTVVQYCTFLCTSFAL